MQEARGSAAPGSAPPGDPPAGRALRPVALYSAPLRSHRSPRLFPAPETDDVTRKLYIRTFGCQMNEYDSDRMADVLAASEGLARTDRAEDADVILFNTCSVREKAAERVFHDLGRVRALKAGSSGWLHETFPEMRGFQWQAGYSIFSVSKSREEVVRRYIVGQEEHHRTQTFIEELKALLEKHGVPFDARYLAAD